MRPNMDNRCEMKQYLSARPALPWTTRFAAITLLGLLGASISFNSMAETPVPSQPPLSGELFLVRMVSGERLAFYMMQGGASVQRSGVVRVSCWVNGVPEPVVLPEVKVGREIEGGADLVGFWVVAPEEPPTRADCEVV